MSKYIVSIIKWWVENTDVANGNYGNWGEDEVIEATMNFLTKEIGILNLLSMVLGKILKILSH